MAIKGLGNNQISFRRQNLIKRAFIFLPEKIQKKFGEFKKSLLLHPRNGEMAERSNAAVLKTVDLHGSGGSNPSLSAKKLLIQGGFFLFQYHDFNLSHF